MEQTVSEWGYILNLNCQNVPGAAGAAAGAAAATAIILATTYVVAKIGAIAAAAPAAAEVAAPAAAAAAAAAAAPVAAPAAPGTFWQFKFRIYLHCDTVCYDTVWLFEKPSQTSYKGCL